MTNKIEIPINKTKTALLLIVPLSIMILGPLLYFSPESFISESTNGFERTRLLGLVAGIAGLILTILIVIKWIRKKTGLIIDNIGITDVSNASYTDLIEWDDIIKVEGKKVGPVKLVVLHTDKPEKYIKKAKKTSVQTMRKNLQFYGSPLLVVSSRLKISYDDLLELINREFQNSKGAAS